MEDIWTKGMDIKDDQGNPIHLSPENLTEVSEAIKIDNGKNIVALYTSSTFTDEQYLAVSEALDDILSCDSGDAEYRACVNVLGKGFDE